MTSLIVWPFDSIELFAYSPPSLFHSIYLYPYVCVFVGMSGYCRALLQFYSLDTNFYCIFIWTVPLPFSLNFKAESWNGKQCQHLSTLGVVILKNDDEHQYSCCFLCIYLHGLLKIIFGHFSFKFGQILSSYQTRRYQNQSGNSAQQHRSHEIMSFVEHNVRCLHQIRHSTTASVIPLT